MSDPRDGNEAIRPTLIGHEQVRAPPWVVEYEVDRNKVRVGLLDTLHEGRGTAEAERVQRRCHGVTLGTPAGPMRLSREP